MKNPNWNREELILAIDLYFRLDYGQMHGKHPEVIQLSEDLRSLNIHKIIPDPKTFRNVNGVSLKLANLKKLDRNFKGTGMKDGGRLEKEIWEEFYRHRDTLKHEAELIRSVYLKKDKPASQLSEDKTNNYRNDFLFQLHKNRESDPLLIRNKKEKILSDSVSLKCEVCKFDAVVFYGEFGNNLLEIHYNREIKEPKLELVSPDDCIVVCSNCHKVLDNNYGLLDSNDLKNIVRKR